MDRGGPASQLGHVSQDVLSARVTVLTKGQAMPTRTQAWRTMRPRRRRAAAAVETAVVLPFVVLFTFGFVEIGWYVNSLQILHTAARNGARAAVHRSNGNAEVQAAVTTSLQNSMDNPEGATVEMFTLDSSGNEQYTIMDLSENEEGHPIRVTVTIDYSQMSPPVNFLGLATEQISCSAVMQRSK